MEAKKRLLTYAGLKALEDELENLKVVKRKEVAQKIKEAREQGDLSENAEYDAAKDEPRAVSEPWRLSAPYHHKLRGARRCAYQCTEGIFHCPGRNQRYWNICRIRACDRYPGRPSREDGIQRCD